LSDDKLLALVGVKTFVAFSMSKLLKSHFLGPAEGQVAEAARAAAAAVTAASAAAAGGQPRAPAHA
jgi:hypothetical protein